MLAFENPAQPAGPGFQGAYGIPPGPPPGPPPDVAPPPESAPLPPPVPTVRVTHLDEANRKAAEEWLGNELRDAFKDRQNLEKKWASWVKQYEGRLERSDQPAAWQSRIDIATTRKHAQAVIARLHNPFFASPEIVKARPRDENFDQFAEAADLLTDYLWDQVESEKLIHGMVRDHVVYGLSVVKTCFYNETKRIKQWQSQPTIDPVSGEIVAQEVEAEVEVPKEVGAIPKRVGPSDFIWPAYATEQATAPWLGHRFYLTEDDIKERIASKDWYDVLPELSPVGEVDCVTKAREELSGIEPTARRYQFVECWCCKDLGQGAGKQYYILTLNPESGKSVRAIYNYYHEYQDPFVVLHWEKAESSMDGTSLCYQLEPYHRAITAATCMELDAASLAIKGWVIFTTEQDLVDLWKSGKAEMGSIIAVTASMKENIQKFEFGNPTPTNMSQLTAQLRADAMELSSLNPYNAGLEQNQRPTASGQQLLVQEGMEPIKMRLEPVRRAVARITQHMLALYKQFYQNQFWFAKQVDGGFSQVVVNFPPGSIESQLFIETVASSDTLNESTQKQELIGVMDRVLQLDQVLLGMVQQGEQAAMQGLASGMVAGGLADGLQKLLFRLLKKFKVPSPEEICPPINALMAMGQQYAQVIQQQQQQLMQMQSFMQSVPAPDQGGGDEQVPGQF